MLAAATYAGDCNARAIRFDADALLEARSRRPFVHALELWARRLKIQENEKLDRLRSATDILPMTMEDRIRRKLAGHFHPDELLVVDESARHAGHAGARPGGETHFDVRIVSPAFEGVSRVERQRLVYSVLADELKASVHALSLTTLTPAEAWQEH